MKSLILIQIFLILGAPQAASGESKWTEKSPNRKGNYLTLPCEGLGPDRSIALRLAINQCVSIAADQLAGDFHVQSVSVETQRDAGYHQEVTADRLVKGLVCQVQKQEVVAKNDSYHAWVECQFDISKFSSVSQLKEHVIEPKSINKLVILSITPTCDDIMVTGGESRLIRCDSNPMNFFVGATDREIIFRTKGYLPKHVRPSELGESYEVYMEKQ